MQKAAGNYFLMDDDSKKLEKIRKKTTRFKRAKKIRSTKIGKKSQRKAKRTQRLKNRLRSLRKARRSQRRQRSLPRLRRERKTRRKETLTTSGYEVRLKLKIERVICVLFAS